MFSTGAGNSGGRFSDRMADLAPTLNAETDQGQFFLPASHVQLLEKLEHLSRYSHFIQVVLGASGSGKSTLLKQFYPSDDDSSVHACYIRAEHGTDLTGLLDDLIEQLSIELPVSAGDEDKLQAIYEQADLLQDISRLFLIVVDDADRLDDDCLDLLVNLLPSVKNPDAKPHLVLFALPKLAERMNASGRFKNTVESSCHFVELMPLEADELESFLQHGFAAEAELLSPQQLQSLHQESFGLPGRVSKVMDKVLSNRGSSSASKKAASWLAFPRLHLLLIVLLVGGISTWLMMPVSFPLGDGDRIRVDLPVPGQANNVPFPEKAEPVAETTLEQRLQEADERLKAEAQAGSSVEVVVNSPRQPLPVVEKPPTKVDEPQASIQLAVAPVKAPVQTKPKPSTVSESVPAKQDGNDDSPKKLVLKIPPVKAESAKEVAKAVVPTVEKSVTVKPATVKPVVKMPRKSSPSSPYLRERELMSWKPSGYTLQMLGARKELSVIQFIRAQANKEQFYYFSTTYKGKPWYVIVYGNYPNRDAAISAVSKLPKKLRQKKPWPRSIKGVQDDIGRKQ
ncbi:MAG: AAA family ATPase [Motiliproteus sp.]|nr:AAA family ATPase [Motiliproteus sp.]MCW9052280.1 AAA family ATPase [Motiliproteus sp.]